MKKILLGVYLLLIISIFFVHPKIKVAEAKPAPVAVDAYADCLKYK